MRGNMKLGKKGNYAVNIILVACVYAVIFALCKLDVKDYAKSYQDIEELLCAVSGFRMTDLPMDIQGQMINRFTIFLFNNFSISSHPFPFTLR